MLRDWALRLATVACIVGAAGLAACGDDDDDNGDGGGDTTPSADETAGGGGNGGEGGTVNVLGIWGDEELLSFEAMVADWPGEVQFTGDRAITARLTQLVAGGSPPDVALPAEIGLFQRFAAEGRLTPLSECEGLEETIRSNYPESFIELGTVDGTLYGFFMKADTKATVFYNPTYFTENSLEPLDESATFDDLMTLSDAVLATGVAPWSIGQEAGDGSGFPASDTIQQIILNDAGAETYDAIVAGDTPYTDPAVRSAWENYGRMALTDGYTVQGGAAGINATAFMDSSYPPFESPPTAGMVHLGGFAAGFITDQFPDAEPGTDFDFFPWPGGAVTGGANIAYAFNSNPATCSFLNYLASAEAQQIWVERGGFTSLNSAVSIDAYPNEIAQKQATQLLEADTFRFDMDDAIGGAGQQAIFAGLLQYLASPGQLDTILEGIEAARQ